MFTITLKRKNKEIIYDIASLNNIAYLLQDKHISKSDLARALLSKGVEVFTLINTPEELVKLVELFPEEEKFTSEIVHLLRDNPDAFIKVVHSTAALQWLCLRLPGLHPEQDGSTSLATFMQLESNACFRAPIDKLVELLNLHLSDEVDDPGIEEERYNAEFAVHVYGNFYVGQERITSVSFLLPRYRYCRLSLRSKEIMLKLPPLTIKTIIETYGLEIKNYNENPKKQREKQLLQSEHLEPIKSYRVVRIENKGQSYCLQSFAGISGLAANANINTIELAQTLLEEDWDTLEPPNYQDLINLYRVFSSHSPFLQKLTEYWVKRVELKYFDINNFMQLGKILAAIPEIPALKAPLFSVLTKDFSYFCKLCDIENSKQLATVFPELASRLLAALLIVSANKELDFLQNVPEDLDFTQFYQEEVRAEILRFVYDSFDNNTLMPKYVVEICKKIINLSMASQRDSIRQVIGCCLVNLLEQRKPFMSWCSIFSIGPQVAEQPLQFFVKNPDAYMLGSFENCTTAQLAQMVILVPDLKEFFRSSAVSICFYQTLSGIYDDLILFPKHREIIALKIMAQKYEPIASITTLAELVILVQYFAEQQGFRRYIVDALRNTPYFFIRIVRTTDDLHKLCRLLPELYKGRDLPSSLVSFLRESSNACFCEPLVELMNEFNKGLPLFDAQQDSLNMSGVKVVRLPLRAYGDFYFEKKLIKSLKFFIFDIFDNRDDVYCQISLSNEKIMIMLHRSLYIKILHHIYSLVVESYSTEADSCSANLKRRDYWIESVSSMEYKTSYYGELHPALIRYISGLISQNYAGRPIFLWEFGCGGATVLQGVCRDLQARGVPYAGLGFDLEPEIVAVAKQSAQGLNCDFYEGNTLELLKLYHTHKDNSLCKQLGPEYVNVYVFCGAVNKQVLESNSQGTWVLQQLARVAKTDDLVVITGRTEPLTCTSLVKRIGWNCRVETLNYKICYVLQKMSPQQRLSALKKQRHKNPAVVDLSYSANPLADLTLLCDEYDDWISAKSIDMTEAYLEQEEQAELGELLNSHFTKQRAEISQEPAVIYPPGDNPLSLTAAANRWNFFKVAENKKAWNNNRLPFSANFHQRWNLSESQSKPKLIS